MTTLAALVLLVAATGGSTAMPAHVPTRAVASASASVRILPGAKVRLDEQAVKDGYKLTPATITVEDGSRRSAKLVEFQ
jgi:hypothetical protein